MSELSYPDFWASIPIEDCLRAYPNGKKIRQGWSPQCENHPAETLDDWGVLKTSAIQDGTFVETANKHLPSKLEPRTHLEVEAGDILMTCAGPRSRCGVTCLVRKTRPKLIISGKMYQLRADPQIIDRYLLEMFLREATTMKRIDEMKTGISDSGLNLTHGRFSTLEVPLPPLNEQKRIVAKIEELFSELDAGEESLRQARRQLGIYRQSLLKQAFEGKLTAQWRKQNPDLLESPDQLLSRIQAEREKRYEEQVEVWGIAFDESKAKGEKKPPKPSILKPVKGEIAIFTAAFPSAWSSLNLSQIALELGQGWSPKCLNQAASSDEWGVMKTTAIQTGRFQAEASKILPPKLSPRPWLGLRHNDILITRAGPRSRCGVVCRVEGDHPKLLLCDKVYRLAFSEQATSSEFIELLLCSPVASDAIERLKTGINDSGVNITQKCFLQLVVPLPSLPEQQEIVRLLDEQFTVIEQNERELDAALKRSETLRQSILKKAFTGQLVPQDPTAEPATELLARIRVERNTAAKAPKKNPASDRISNS